MTPSEQRQTMIAYLKLKVEMEDWHGVADAAMDLRELEARAAVHFQTANPASSTPG